MSHGPSDWRGRGSYLLHFEQREGRREIGQEKAALVKGENDTSQRLFCSSKNGGSCLRGHRKSWLDRASCLDKKKEKTGKNRRKVQV